MSYSPKCKKIVVCKEFMSILSPSSVCEMVHRKPWIDFCPSCHSHVRNWAPDGLVSGEVAIAEVKIGFAG
jgi:hypothetical protein